MCAKNYKKNKFKFVEVIQEKVFETEDTELIIKFLQWILNFKPPLIYLSIVTI